MILYSTIESVKEPVEGSHVTVNPPALGTTWTFCGGGASSGVAIADKVSEKSPEMNSPALADTETAYSHPASGHSESKRLNCEPVADQPLPPPLMETCKL